MNGALEGATVRAHKVLNDNAVHRPRRYFLHGGRMDSIVKPRRPSKPACHLHPSNHHSSAKNPSPSRCQTARRVSSPHQGRAPSQPVPAGHHASRRCAAATSTLSELRTACKRASNESLVSRFSTFHRLDSSIFCHAATPVPPSMGTR